MGVAGYSVRFGDGGEGSPVLSSGYSTGQRYGLADALHREKLGIPRQLLPKWGLRYEDVEKSLKVIEQQWTWFDW